MQEQGSYEQPHRQGAYANNRHGEPEVLRIVPGTVKASESAGKPARRLKRQGHRTPATGTDGWVLWAIHSARSKGANTTLAVTEKMPGMGR